VTALTISADTKYDLADVISPAFRFVCLSCYPVIVDFFSYVVVGDAVGRMQTIDLRMGNPAVLFSVFTSISFEKVFFFGFHYTIPILSDRQVGVFKGFAGAIRSVAYHPTLPLVASCGLDRFLRVHDVHTRKLKHKVYLKQKLNCLLFSSALPEPEKEQGA